VRRRGLAILGLCCFLGSSFAGSAEAKKESSLSPEHTSVPKSPAPPGPAAPLPHAKSSKPWYKTPIGITTLVVVHVAALAILLSGDGEESASPSLPPPSR